MEGSCFNLEVDVNGEETFMANKEIISSYSGRLSRLFRKTKGTQNFKVVFHDFPGGAEGFELMTRFCYNNGNFEISPSNVVLLYCVAQYMEMKTSVSISCNLLEETEKSFEEINYWTWSELLGVLKQCQQLLPFVKSSGILQKCMDSLVRKLVLTTYTSPCQSISSTDSSRFRFSYESRSTTSSRTLIAWAPWWFEDLVVLNPCMIEDLVEAMISWKFDHRTICRFLFYYHKSKLIATTTCGKREITETVINALNSLDLSIIRCKSLFGILQASLSLKISKCCRNKLENMIGTKLDQATLDNLLLRSPVGTNCLYDVNLVLRFLKAFVTRDVYQASPAQLKKVASLIDQYLAEVAPDPDLKPSKLLALATALPDFARDSYDGVYRAMDIYLEVHAGLSEEELVKIFSALNYEKLSFGASVQLSQNTKFSSKVAVQALISQQCKVKTLLQDAHCHSKCFADSPCSFTGSEDLNGESNGQTLVYSGTEKLKAHLQGMQTRVKEVEKVCSLMQTQVRKIMKSRSVNTSSHCNFKSLPKFL